jgi:hypothetical protein
MKPLEGQMGHKSDRIYEGNNDHHPKVKTISSLVQSEANLRLAEESILPNPTLISEGWERRFITDENKALELTSLYEELGFEVVTEEIQPDDFNSTCKDCGLFTLIPLVMIYTRK